MNTGGRPWLMRYSGHLGLRTPDAPLFRHSARSADPVDQIAYLAQIGFAGVQDSFLKLRTPAAQAGIGAALREHGLVMGSINNNPRAWNRPLWSRTDAGARDELARDFEESAAASQRTGCALLVCVTAFDPDEDRKRQEAGMVENLARFADLAAQLGLTLCVEPVAESCVPGLLVNSLEQARSVVDCLAHPAVRLLFDVAHVEESDGNAFTRLRACWSTVAAVQAADVPGRVDLGSGRLDWPSILRWLRDVGYAGLVEIEHEPREAAAAGEAALLTRLRAVDGAI